MNDPAAIVARSAVAEAQHLLATYAVPNYGRLDLVPDHGSGAWLWDAAGRKYLDFGGGVAVTSIGHCHEAIVQAIESQSRKLIHCSNWYQIAEQGRLAKFLVEKVVREPGKCFFCNSGAEANEALIKLARKFGHATPAADGSARVEIITFSNSFHGRTYAGISATAQAKVKEGFAPLLEGFVHLEFNDTAALQHAVNDRTVAILLEPIQGEGGIHLANREFLDAIWKICQERNILLLFDEVQCGLGRAGHWCGWKAVLEAAGAADSGLVPDGVSWAKGIGGGFPIGGVWIRRRPVNRAAESGLQLCDVLGPGSHGTTYGGNPLGCAVALAVLGEIDRAGLCGAARRHGEWIRQEAAAWRSPYVKDVRGLGLLLGFELDSAAIEKSHSWQPGGTAAIFIVKQLMAAGLLTVAAGPHVVRWLPPLNVTREEITEALTIFRSVLQKL
jgi:predicted acetylornithine/succinylornithine family transaminase